MVGVGTRLLEGISELIAVAKRSAVKNTIVRCDSMRCVIQAG